MSSRLELREQWMEKLHDFAPRAKSFAAFKSIFFGAECAHYYLQMKTIKKLLCRIDDPDFGMLYCLNMTTRRTLPLALFLKFAPQKEFKLLRMDEIDNFIPERGKGEQE